MKHHLLIAGIRDISLYVHWTWFMMLGFSLGLCLYEGWAVALLLASLGLLMVIHEAGHALLARCCHCPVRAISLHPLHGACYYELPGDGLAVLREAVVAWGGVLGQLLVLLPAGLVLWLWGWRETPLLNVILLVLGPVNAMLILLNLIPTAPLDGARAWRLIPLLRRYRSPTARPGRSLEGPGAKADTVVELASLEPDPTDLYHMLCLKCLYDQSRVARLLAQEQRRHPRADRPELLKHALRRFDRKLEDG